MTQSDLPNARDAKGVAHRRIIRFTAYSVASVLAVLLLTAALPPLVADQSDRAILNAPVTLMTSPIAGEVTTLDVKTGGQSAAGTVIASVTNGRVDRTTLLLLESKAAGFREAISSAKNKYEADMRYVQALDVEIGQQKQQLIKQFATQASDLKGQVGSAQALVAEKIALRDRQVNMVSRDVASSYMLKPTTEQLSGAEGMLASATAKLASSTSQLEAVKRDIFVGDNLVGIATLAQKRRDMAFDAEHQKIEQTEAGASLAEETRSLEAERSRVETMTKADLVSNGGEVLHVGVALGRHVNAGDSLVTLVDCKSAFAVAIFSYRQAASLSVGTPMSISMEGLEAPLHGAVSEIIPKSSDKTDALYALPFPQSERREMFVIVKPVDGQAATRMRSGSGACPVGQWVTVTRSDGWIPSTSVIWRKASDKLASLVSGLFTSSAEAQQRRGS